MDRTDRSEQRVVAGEVDEVSALSRGNCPTAS